MRRLEEGEEEESIDMQRKKYADTNNKCWKWMFCQALIVCASSCPRK